MPPHIREMQKASNDLLDDASEFNCAKLAGSGASEAVDPEQVGSENETEKTESNDFGFDNLAALCQQPVTTQDEEPSIYMCSDMSASRGKIISYEYQVYFTVTTEKMEATKEELETQMLEYLADKTHLKECDSGAPIVRHRLRRSLQRRRDGELFITETDGAGGKQNLVGLSSQPPDEIMPRNFNNESECPQAFLKGIKTECRNVKGSVAAYFDAETDGSTMSEYVDELVSLIGVALGDGNTGVLVSESVPLIYFKSEKEGSAHAEDPSIVENPTIVEDPPRVEDPISAEDPTDTAVPQAVPQAESPKGIDVNEESSKSGFELGFALIGVGCAVIALLAFLIYKKRRTRAVRGEPEYVNDHTTFAESEVGITSEKSGEVEIEVKNSVADQATMAESVSTPFKHEETPKEGMPSVGENQNDHGESAMPALSSPVSPLEPLSSSNNAGNNIDTTDDYTVTTAESGVTLEFDFARTNSDISELTWYGPRPSSAPPQNKNTYSPQVAVINEEFVEEGEDEDEDEDPLELVASIDHSTEGSKELL